MNSVIEEILKSGVWEIVESLLGKEEALKLLDEDDKMLQGLEEDIKKIVAEEFKK
jgi:hypothetical protein